MGLRLIASAVMLASLVDGQAWFVENAGQFADDIRFCARTGRMTVFLKDASFVVQLRDPVVDGAPLRGANVVFEIEGAASRARVLGAQPLAGRVHHLLGPDPARWITDIPTWSALRTRGVRPGVDLDFKLDERRVEYDVVLAAGASARDVVFLVRGADALSVDADGTLVIETAVGLIRQEIPAAWQVGPGGARTRVACRTRLLSPDRFGFEVDGAIAGAPVVIDPILTYAGYLSGNSGDEAYAIVTDASGAVYTAGRSSSANYPTSPGAFDTAVSGTYDAFVTKSDAAGTAMLWSTYLGSPGTDLITAITVNASGQATVTGSTGSGFPTTSGAYDTTYSAWKDGFVTRLNASGTALVFSTYLGGNHDEQCNAIAVDAGGNIVVAGKTQSTNFPTSAGAYSSANGGYWDGFVVKLNPTATALLAGTYLGSAGLDWIHGVALAQGGAIVVAGSSDSPGFPTTPGAFDPTPNGSLDAFVAKLTPTLNGLTWATMLGSSGLDHAHDVAIGPGDTAYVTGVALPGFPSTSAAYDPTNDNGDAYVARLTAAGDGLVYATFLGGSATEQGDAISVDANGVAYVTGFTTSVDFPVTAGAVLPSFGGGGAPGDAFLAKLNAQGSRLDYATYFGGSGYEEGRALARGVGGAVFIAGSSASTNIPVPPGAFDTPLGLDDGFFAKLTLPLAATASLGPGYAPGSPGTALALGDLPVLGHVMTLWVTNAPTSAPAGIVISAPAPPTLVNGVLPLYVSPATYLVLGTFLTSPTGSFALPVTLPANAALAALTLHAQAVVVSAQSAFGFEVSNGVSITTGF